MPNYKKIVKEIRKKSFPEIKGKIWIIKIPFPIPGASVMWLLPRINLLAFSTQCGKSGKKSLVGLIVHELSHFSIFQKGTWMNFWRSFFFGTLEQAIKNERETDKLAIRKGYGKEILAMRISAKKRLKGTKWEKFLDRYMTVEEVKEYMKKIKKQS